MIEALSEHYPVTELCGAFGLHRSRFYNAIERRSRVDTQRQQLREQVVHIHTRSRCAHRVSSTACQRFCRWALYGRQLNGRSRRSQPATDRKSVV